jgi:hypothetical protein
VDAVRDWIWVVVAVSAKGNRLGNQAEPMKQLEKLIRENAYRHQLHAVFADFCEMSALSISNRFDLARYDKREARYLEIVGRYNREEIDRFPKMLGCLVEALEQEMRDHLGKLFMALELGNHWKGQFFTPYEVALLMAQMQLHDAKELIEQQGFITLSEPSAGAGCMVIASAQALRDLEINYQEAMHVTAVDLDPTAAHMAYVQMSLLYIPGVVVVGDTLRLEERDHWYTPAHFMGLWELRRRERGTVVEAKPEAPTAVTEQRQPTAGQLDLFASAGVAP